MRLLLLTALLASTPAMAQTASPEVATPATSAASADVKPRWRKVPMPAWLPSAMYDETTTRREGDIVTAWVRFNKAGRINPKAVGETKRTSDQIDLLTKVDCKENRAAFVGRRITDRRGSVRQEDSPNSEWRPTMPGSNGDFMTTALCKSA